MKQPSRLVRILLIGLVCVLFVPLDSSHRVLGQDGDGTSTPAPFCPCPCPLTMIAAIFARPMIESFIPDSAGGIEIDTSAQVNSIVGQISNFICMCPCQVNTLSLGSIGSKTTLGKAREMRDGLAGSELGQLLSKVYYGVAAGAGAS
ncbi:hypothetical protein ACFL1X_04980 [Candidatus Hydrogenedentota bacterium]